MAERRTVKPLEPADRRRVRPISFAIDIGGHPVLAIAAARLFSEWGHDVAGSETRREPQEQ